jgi:hypothetical protein
VHYIAVFGGREFAGGSCGCDDINPGRNKFWGIMFESRDGYVVVVVR